MKIKELPENESLGGVHFYSKQHGVKGYWCSQWGYEDGKAGVWYKRDMKSSSVFPLFLDNLKEALEFEVIDDAQKQTKSAKKPATKPRKRRSNQEGLPLPDIG